MGDAETNASARTHHYDMAIKNLRLAQKFSGRDYEMLATELQSKIGGQKIADAGRAEFTRGVEKIKKSNNVNAGNTVAMSHDLGSRI